MPEQEQMRTIAYICPHCRQTVIADKSLFSLAAAPTKIPCPCGKSELEIEFLPDRVRLNVPCLFCGHEHRVTCATTAFVREKALAFSCAASGLDCCYVGEEQAVYAAAVRLERATDKLAQAQGEEQVFLDELVMHEVLSELKEIAGRGGVSCTCGSRQWDFRINYSSIDLLCTKCGAQMRIPAATADDIDDICCKTSLLIHGRSKEDLAQ